MFHIAPAEFDRHLGELDALSEDADGVHSMVRVDDVRERYEAIRFIERRVVPVLRPEHSAPLGR